MADSKSPGRSPGERTGRPRPAQRSAATPPATPTSDEVIIDSHRDLVRHRSAMITAVSEKPELLRLLLVNPVLAFRDAGITISPAVADHILHSIVHPPAVATERESLASSLRKSLGVAPRPADPEWLAHTMFVRLDVPPLDTGGRQPRYSPAIPADARERLEALLPRRRRRQVTPPRDRPPPAPQARHRLDLDAPVESCPPATAAPQSLTLEELWFYRGHHDLVVPLLRLGIIDSTALPILGATAYRQVKAGTQQHDLLRWVDDIAWPTTTRGRRPT